jgi:hypothetical protein
MTNQEAEAVTGAILNLIVSVMVCVKATNKKYSKKKTADAARSRFGARIGVSCNELIEQLEALS